MSVWAGVDVGGTRTKGVLLDADDLVRAETVRPTPRSLDIADLVEQVLADLQAAGPNTAPTPSPVACGLVVPGLVDERGGVGRYSANLGWRDLPLREPASARLGIPVVVGHDVRAGLVAEARLGAARGHADALFLPLGTGIAGALLVDGRVLTGGGWAGEIGHIVVEPDGPLCGCTQRGCLEAVASARAVERAYRSASGNQLTGAQITAAVRAGDPVAVAVWARAVDALAYAIATCLTITGVDLVVVGGGLSNAGATLIGPLDAAVKARLTFQRPAQIVLAELGDRAGALGAALLARGAP